MNSSKGNQFKYCEDDFWYKKDSLGYEALAEDIVSFILSKSNISNFCKYSIIEKTDGFYSKSKNFLSNGRDLITLQKFFRLRYGVELHLKMLEFSEMQDKIKYVVDTVGLEDFGKYLVTTLELDAITLDDDRHFNNIALLFDGNTYSLPPLFDFGAAFYSDITFDYPMTLDSDTLLKSQNAKPFSRDFDEQIDAAESLYGTQLKLYTNADEVCSYVDSIKFYSLEIKERVKSLVRYTFRKYRYLLVSPALKNLHSFDV